MIALFGLDVPSTPCARVLVCRPNDAPTLLFSDEPETTSVDGIVYADVITPGRYRAYVYHVNAGASLRKFPLVVLNQGATTATITVTRRGLAGPTTDYVAAGKSAVIEWLGATQSTSVSVAPGQRVLLDAGLDSLHAKKDELVHAIIDFDVDAQLKVSVVSVPANADATALTAGLSVVPSSGLHVRGTFPFAEYVLVGDGAPDASVRSLVLGANQVDPDLIGHSFVDGAAPVVLHGGFGVPYDIVWPIGNELGLLLSPRGGAWGGASVMSAGEDLAAGLAPLPKSQTTLDSGPNGIHAGRFAKGSTATLKLMTGGGSSLPVALLFVPLGG